jgi:sarcosine oxidase, subunit beta
LKPSGALDVAIVGAGITGLAVAWHLADRRAGKIGVFERSGVAAEASGVQPGGVRHQWGTRINCELAVESSAFYRELNHRLSPRVPLTLENCGYLFLAESEKSLEALRENVAVQNAAGVRSQIVTPAEAENLVPGLVGSSTVGGAWCADDGYFDHPQGVVHAFADAAVNAGVALTIADVRSVVRDGDGWELRFADGAALSAQQVVVACGYDTPALVEPLGIELPIEKQARYLFLSEPIRERLLDPLVVASESTFAAKQLADGRVLASDLSASNDVDGQRRTWRSHVAVCVKRFLPVLEFVSYPILIEGFYDSTPDHQPILGSVAGFDGLWLAVGFSGHGFMMAPAIGRRLADAIVGVGSDSCLDEFSLPRFNGSELRREPQIV